MIESRALATAFVLAFVAQARARAADAPPMQDAPAPPDVPLPQAIPAPDEASRQPSAPPPGPAPADAALGRVLRSGCREGLPQVYALVGDPSAPWAATVMRQCAEILAGAPPGPAAALEAGPSYLRRAPPAVQDGRGRLVFWSALYGTWIGVATDVLFGISSGSAVVLPPMLGMSAGIVVSLTLTSGVHLTTGEAWTIITGLDYGSINGALWAGALNASDKAIVGTAVASSVAATALGLAVADAASPSAGAIEVCRSGLLWGTVGGYLVIKTFASEGVSTPNILLATAIGMDAGFLGGLAIARKVDLSSNRVLIIDAGAIGGAVGGLAVSWILTGGTGASGGHGQALAGGALAGLVGGIAIAAFATRDLDASAQRRATAAAAVPALWTRDADGRWHPGAPAPLPVFAAGSTRLTGAAVNGLGGVF